MDWIIEENAQSRLKEPEVEENTEAELIESDVAVQELDVEHIELMNSVSIGFPGMAPDVEPIELIDWVKTQSLRHTRKYRGGVPNRRRGCPGG
jgi:hypothetical protein